MIVIKDGAITKSGQGLSIFKWPSESVALVPMSVRKLSFKADQVTLEKTGVEVTGLAVYRIAQPLIAYRMIDGDMGMLPEILRDMFIGATRRIVASLSLEECITHRKERVAEALVREIAPVLRGEGRTEDETDMGWGVVIDTIEIQDVRVLSAEVFSRLQAPYREKLALEALRAEEQVIRERERLEVERHKANETLARANHEAEIARRMQQTEAERTRVAIELETKKHEGAVQAEIARLQRERTDLTEAQLREILFTQTIPQVAASLRGAIQHLNVTTTDANVARLLSAGVQAFERSLVKLDGLK